MTSAADRRAPMRWLGWLGLSVAMTSSVAGQTPVQDLAKPPATARHFIIQSTGGRHGESWMWEAPDGIRMGRESMNLRGQVFELDSSGKAGAEGMPMAITVRGFTPQGDAGETFTIAQGTARWKRPIDSGNAAYATPAFYVAQGGPMAVNAWLIEALLARPDRTLTLLPGGRAHAEKLTDLQVGAGAAARTITLWGVTGLGTSPVPIWSDTDNHFFAVSFGLAWLPEAYASEQPKIEDAQAKALASQAPGLRKSLLNMPKGPVAFVGVRLFDADAPKFVADQTVVVDKGAIVAVGPRDAITVPPGAQVVDGSGKTLVPGLWDCHMHVGDDYTGV